MSQPSNAKFSYATTHAKDSEVKGKSLDRVQEGQTEQLLLKPSEEQQANLLNACTLEQCCAVLPLASQGSTPTHTCFLDPNLSDLTKTPLSLLLSSSDLIAHPENHKSGLISPYAEEGEEVETRSGASSHSSAGRRGVRNATVETDWLRALREGQSKRECLENSVHLLRQELKYLQRHTEQLSFCRTQQQTLLSLQRLSTSFHAPSFLRSLQASMQQLVSEVEEWQTHFTPTLLRAVDQWRLTALRAVPGAQVRVWDSLAVRLHLPYSGVDVLIMQSGLGERQTLENIQKQCELEGISTELIVNTRPIVLKVTFQDAILHVSVLSSAHKGFQRTSFMRDTLKANPLLRPVYLTLKHLWSQCQVLDPSVGGPGAFGLFLLTAAVVVKETGSAADLVYRFFQYYAYECNYLQTISITTSPVSLASPALTVLDPSGLNLTEAADLGNFVVRSRQHFARMVLSTLLIPVSCTCAQATNLLLKALLEMQRWLRVQTP